MATRFKLFLILFFCFCGFVRQQGTTKEHFVFWPNATIPFYINPEHFDKEQSVAILSSLSLFAFKTCLQFKPVFDLPKKDAHVMLFQNPDAVRKCVIDREGHDRQNAHAITIGFECIKSPQIDMIIMKALGFPFEHNRASRDLYIDVQFENIEPGAVELYTKEKILPVELRALPYDVNSVMHFSERDFSKNGHRTFIFKNQKTQQQRIGLSEVDIQKINIIYGPECKKRERQAKIDICRHYPIPKQSRKKREVDVNQTQSLRINRDITPPPHQNLTGSLEKTLNELGLESEIQDLIEEIHQLTGTALRNAREKSCNESEDELRAQDGLSIHSHSFNDVLEIVETVCNFIKDTVDAALSNTTAFCSSVDKDIQRFGINPWNPRSTKVGNVWYSTQHRPNILQSTRHDGSGRKPLYDVFLRSDNGTEVNATETVTVRKKRSAESDKTFVIDGKPSVIDEEVMKDENEEIVDVKGLVSNQTSNKASQRRYIDDREDSPYVSEKRWRPESSDLYPQKKRIRDRYDYEDTRGKKKDIKRPWPRPMDTEENGGDRPRHSKYSKEKIDSGSGEYSRERIYKKDTFNKQKYNWPEDTSSENRYTKKRNKPKFEESNNFQENAYEKKRSEEEIYIEPQEFAPVKNYKKKQTNKQRYTKNDIELTPETPYNKKRFQKQRNRENKVAEQNKFRDKIFENERNKDNTDLESQTLYKKEKVENERNKEFSDMESDQFYKKKKIEDEWFTDLKDETKKPHNKNRYVKQTNFNSENIHKPNLNKKKRKKEQRYPDPGEESTGNNPTEDDKSEEEEILENKTKHRQKDVQQLKQVQLPKTVTLSNETKEFYQERMWPDGIVPYIIEDNGIYDLKNMRRRLKEVVKILEEKTCVRMEEITESEAHKYNDYLILDTSPDFVTGKVGGKQNFGVLELFEGGQHRQHAAMMVMAMLGFYFEVARQDRDKHIRVHVRHIRPDKLHHFEKLITDALFPLPYDYKSATHPAWQYWRRLGKKGISTVATYKDKDPDGSIMKSLGQNKQLLSNLDIVKINTVYGTKCFEEDSTEET